VKRRARRGFSDEGFQGLGCGRLPGVRDCAGGGFEIER
jgi:hypothetical protein